MLGVIMAGGESRRLGMDKATVMLGNEPLWRRQQQVLREAGATRTVMVRRPGQFAPADVECWYDQVAGVGPMGGLHTALVAHATDQIAVLAVDMPGIAADWFHWLGEACGPGCGAMVRHVEACEPMAAIYPSSALAEVTSRLAHGDYSLQRLALALAEAGHMTLIPLSASAKTRLRSINTPEDLDYWMAREEGTEPVTPEPARDARIAITGAIIFPANSPLSR